MLRSMTGYGRGEAEERAYGEFFVEIHGVNRKYCEVNVNLPKHLLVLEPKIREIILANIARGRINVFVGQTKIHEAQKLFINIDLVKKYYDTLKKIKKGLKLKGELNIGLISGLKDFIVQTEPEVDSEKVWPIISRALSGAIKHFQAMREKEGATICRQIEKPLEDVKNRVAQIESIVPQVVKNFKERLENKIKEIGLSVSSTDERIQKEIAILAEHMDITEEINRMESHLIQFKSLAKKDEPVGRTMDFLIQEMMRETNTMGSKAVHTEISTHIVYIKSQLEKIREQIQNVE